MNIEVTTQQQYASAYYMGAALFVLGLISIGIGTGLYLGIQSVFEAGCPTEALAQQPCHAAVKTMNTRVLYSLGAGVVGMVSGSAIMLYLRRYVP